MKRVLLLAAILIVSITVIGCQRDAGLDAPASLPEKTVEVSIFYAIGSEVIAEGRVIEDSADILKTILREAFETKPREKTDVVLIQPKCKVLAVTLDQQGLATVNFSKEILDFDATDQEKMMAYSAIIENLKQFQEVKSVKFQVEGKESGTIAGKDIKSFWGSVSLIGQPWSVK